MNIILWIIVIIVIIVILYLIYTKFIKRPITEKSEDKSKFMESKDMPQYSTAEEAISQSMSANKILPIKKPVIV